MKKIWKYELNVRDEQMIKVPVLVNTEDFRKQFLQVQVIDNRIFIWCFIDDTMPERKVFIETMTTGRAINDSDYSDYLGSYSLDHGQFIGHLFVKS